MSCNTASAENTSALSGALEGRGVDTGVPTVEEIIGTGVPTSEYGLVSVVPCTDLCIGVLLVGATVGLLANDVGWWSTVVSFGEAALADEHADLID